MMQPFPRLSATTLEAINTVGQWLAQDDFCGGPAYPADCVVLAGNAVIPTIDAACQIAQQQEVPLLIAGGIGHSTTFLYAAVAQHPRYNTIQTTGRAEAAILADIARQFWHIPADKIWLEDQSTEDESEALETLFSEYLLPWCGAFLGKVEAHATTPFWRTMAPLTRDAISAMWDELEEDSEE